VDPPKTYLTNYFILIAEAHV